MTREILTIKVPVPVPAIKTFSRWRVFLALFDRRSHFTTCDTLQHRLTVETDRATRQTLDRLKVDKLVIERGSMSDCAVCLGGDFDGSYLFI